MAYRTGRFLADQCDPYRSGSTRKRAPKSPRSGSLNLPDVQVLLTDIDMPGGLDGLMLARIVCKRLPSIEIIVVSGMRPPNANELPSGGISYNKPYDFGAMTTQLQRMCQRRRRLPSDSERSSPL